MCRKNKVISAALIGFGAGLLVGIRIGSGFFTTCLGLGLIAVGVLFLQKQV